MILVLARIIGKKQLSQLTFFHYITGTTIRSIAAEVSTHKKAMKKARLHPDELAMLLREQGIFSYNEVHYAVFETKRRIERT